MISFAVHEISNDNVCIRSLPLIEEMRHFVHLGNERYGGAAGSKDDRVMAYMIALTTSDDENFEKWLNTGKSRATKIANDDPRVVIPERNSWNTDPWHLNMNKIEKEYSSWD